MKDKGDLDKKLEESKVKNAEEMKAAEKNAKKKYDELNSKYNDLESTNQNLKDF